MNPEMLSVDLHCHPNLKSFNSGFPKPKYGMWENIRHKIDSKFANTINGLAPFILKQSQSNLLSLAEGNVRVFNVSLYPTERGFLHLRNVPKIMIGKNRINIMQEVITGYDSNSITEQKKHDRYFDDLLVEYEFVKNAVGKSPDGNRRFIIANNYKELQQGLEEENTLVGIMSIEGAHVLGAATAQAANLSGDEMLQMLTLNIQAIKGWEYPPFTINLAHHFWNGLCGHATSFKPPVNSLINQNKGKDKGITDLGWHVVRELLSRKNGKRVLIDVKHMSVAGRKEYYSFISNYNYVNAADSIPVICSHCGVNGYNTMDASIREKDIAAKTRTTRFHKWSINLSNEELRIIHQSKGLIGLMMDRGILGGIEVVKKIAAIKDAGKQRQEYCKLFWDNAFQAVKAIEEKSAWDIVAYGSDFDGTITHMDPYESSARLPLMQHDLIRYLEDNRYQEELWMGYTPTQLVKKIMGENAMKFYERFFV